MTPTETYLLIGGNAILIFAMITIGLISYIRTKRFLDNAIKTNGKVIELVYKGAGDGGGAMYSPKIEFTTATGQPVQFTERWSSNRPDYKVGDEAPLYYDPENPSKAKLAQKKGMMFFVAYFVGGLGILFLFIGIIIGVMFMVISFTTK